MRRADCPSVGCCVTASAAYPPRALGWSTAASMRRTKAAAIRRPLSTSAVSSVTTFSRLSRRARGGAHRASEGSWSSETSSTSWSSWKLQRWSALAPTHGRSKSPLGLTGLLLVSGDPGHDKNMLRPGRRCSSALGSETCRMERPSTWLVPSKRSRTSRGVRVRGNGRAHFEAYDI